jgi:D-alanyl-D-alanine carboxypeptidase
MTTTDTTNEKGLLPRRRVALLTWLVAALVGLLVTAGVAGGGTTATTAASASPQVSVPTKPMSEADAAPIAARAELTQSIFSDDVPGLLVGVWDPVKGVYIGGFGVADTTSGRAPTGSDVFRIGSVTKTFTAALVLQLVAEGKLKLDGRVATYAPKLAKRHPELGSRTIQQLLSMRSGLPEYTDPLVGIAPRRGWEDKVWMPNQLIDFAFKSGPVTAPNALPPVYTNTNYIALGEILTAVTGKTLPDLVSTRLLGPLRLKRTSYPRLAATTLSAPSTHGYVTTGGLKDFAAYGSTVEPMTDVSDWSASWGGAAGIMTSTLGDLARWEAAGFGSALLPPKLRAARTATAAAFPAYGPTARYGLGLQIIGDWQGHFGGIPGWTTMALRNTKTGVIVAASVNACCGPQTGVLLQFFLARLYPGTGLPGS